MKLFKLKNQCICSLNSIHPPLEVFIMFYLLKLIIELGLFYGMFLLATLLSVLGLFIILSVYNQTNLLFLKTDTDKFYGLFVVGFVLCALVIDSSTKFAGWTNIFVLLSIVIGIALFVIFGLFFFNINLGILTQKSDFIYLLGLGIFLKVGIATIHRILVYLSS